MHICNFNTEGGKESPTIADILQYTTVPRGLRKSDLTPLLVSEASRVQLPL